MRRTWQGFFALVGLLWRAGRPVLWCLPLALCAPLSDLPVLFGGDPVVRTRRMGTPLRGRTPSHTILTLPAFEKGLGHQFEGV